MMTLMLGIYALIRFFDCYEKERIKEFFLMSGRVAGTYLIGIGLAAPLFIPAVVGFLTSDRLGAAVERNYFSYGWAYYRKNFLRIIAPTGSWVSLSLAAIALPAVVLLLSQRKNRRSLKLLLIACAAIYALPLGGYIMNGFSYPSQRWTFGAALLLSYIVVEMLPLLLNLNERQQAVCLLTLLLYSACVFVGASNRSIYYVLGVAMLAVTLFVLLCVKNMQCGQGAQKLRSAGAGICVLLVIANVSVNAVFRFARDQGNVASGFEVCGAETARLESVIEREAEPYLDEKDGRFDSRLWTHVLPLQFGGVLLLGFLRRELCGGERCEFLSQQIFYISAEGVVLEAGRKICDKRGCVLFDCVCDCKAACPGGAVRSDCKDSRECGDADWHVPVHRLELSWTAFFCF